MSAHNMREIFFDIHSAMMILIIKCILSMKIICRHRQK